MDNLRLLLLSVALVVSWWFIADAVATYFDPASRLVANLIGMWLAINATMLMDALVVACVRRLLARRGRSVP